MRDRSPATPPGADPTGRGLVERVPVSQWRVAWRELRGNGLFWVAAALLLLVASWVVLPGQWTDVDPTYCATGKSLAAGEAGHPLGFTFQGCDVYARTVHGARASVLVGFLATLCVTLVGLATGAAAGFYGGWVDTVISRIADVFFAVPLLLAALVGLSVLGNVWPDRGFLGGVVAVVAVLAVFGWPHVTRITRGAVLEVCSQEFVAASRAIGATPRATLLRHVLPNALAPVIVVATVSLGVFIVAEATLSFLGIGLPTGVVSWGNDIANAQRQVRSGQRLGVMFWPAGALAITVFAFILLGDTIRDALDPTTRRR